MEAEFTSVALVFAGICFVLVVGAIFMPTRQEKTGRRASSAVKNAYTQNLDEKSNAYREKSRKNVRQKLKKIEQREDTASLARKVTLDQRLQWANWEISAQNFIIYSSIFGLLFALVAALAGQSMLIVMAAFIIMGFGVPRWVLGVITRRRQKKFLNDFPGGIDVIIRGLRSGLPLNECLKVIAKDLPAPVGEEFDQLTEGLRVGMSLEQGVEKLYERIPLQEVSFFGIVLSVQKKTGGNLAEALHNLSTVIRSRKTMQGKISALSMEAKASAVILGALPIVLAFILNVASPNHLDPLFNTQMGHYLLMVSAVLMALGIFTMKKMCEIKI